MNKFTGMGRLTKDPILTFFESGKKICKFTLAITRSHDREKADFIPCHAWDKLAEIAEKHLKKGDLIVVAGNIETRTWDKDDGTKGYATEIKLDEIHFTGKAGESSSTEESYKPQVEKEEDSESDSFGLGSFSDDEESDDLDLDFDEGDLPF